MDTVAPMVVSVLVSVLAASGFWSFVMKHCDKKDVRNDMLIGLGHDRIISLGLAYIDRGWLTQAEYENIKDYLFKPYAKMGGNGTAEKIIQEVDKLPIRPTNTVEGDVL